MSKKGHVFDTSAPTARDLADSTKYLKQRDVRPWFYDPEGGSVLSGSGKVSPKSNHICIAWVHTGHADGYKIAAAQELHDALKALLAAYEMLLPGIKNISVPDYQLLNLAPILASAALRKAGGPT